MVHLERWFCRRNFNFTEVEVTERVISTLLPMEWKLLFHFRPVQKNRKDRFSLLKEADRQIMLVMAVWGFAFPVSDDCQYLMIVSF